jgi:transglutaminase-like putative cysteine protease
MLPETAEVAMREGWPSDPSPDIARTAGVPVLGRIMDARNVGTLRLRLRGATVPIPASETQRPDGDELVLERQRLTPAMTYALPFPGAELSEFLEPTALVQSDHPRFRGLSAEILADHRDAQDAARILTSWVHSYLRKEPTVSIPNALQVLDMGKGDCNEHAILLAALLRAAGIPNRLAVGLVYEDGTFLYHAWNEVWLNGWVAADSTFGQFPADVARIKLGDGGAEAMLAILPYLGNLSVEVIAQGE